MPTLFLATGNTHKQAELRTLLASARQAWTVESAAALGGLPPVDENADTFAGNALLKARALRALAPADAWVLADDSGLEVDALDGAPGVRSARYAGPNAGDAANNAKLLRELAAVPESRRGARFVCVLALLAPDGSEHLFEGVCNGRIGAVPAGASGFGYDPLFIPNGYAQTFAELGAEVKNRLSHRARAREQLLAHLGGA
jgi:XTP/dITP diphosphohydrolase